MLTKKITLMIIILIILRIKVKIVILLSTFFEYEKKAVRFLSSDCAFNYKHCIRQEYQSFDEASTTKSSNLLA